MVKTLFQSARPAFLMLTAVSVFLGVSTALYSGALINHTDLAFVFIGAIFAHISVNLLNEYIDFKSGLDFKTIKTPFSGGSGALIENPGAINAVLYFGITSLIMTALLGLYLVYLHGPLLLAIGVLGCAIILTYTEWINRKSLLCLIVPGLSFGPLMIVGTHFVLTGEYSLLVFLASLVPFFLVNNLLLLNQLPDIKADKSVGRLHFPIKHGVASSLIVYAVFILATFAVIVFGTIFGVFPPEALLALIPVCFAIFALFGASKHAATPNKLTPYLAINVLTSILAPLVLGACLIVA